MNGQEYLSQQSQQQDMRGLGLDPEQMKRQQVGQLVPVSPAPAVSPGFEVLGDYSQQSALFGALASAQAAFGPLVKSKHVRIVTREKGTYEFDYAPLESIFAAVLPGLNANGLALLQPYWSNAEGTTLMTMLVHAGGGSVRAKVRIPGQDDPKALGSALTYAKRYSVASLLGVNAEDDDDGSGANGDQIENRPYTKQRTPPAPPPKADAKSAPKAEAPKEEPKPEPRKSEPPPANVPAGPKTYVEPKDKTEASAELKKHLGAACRMIPGMNRDKLNDLSVELLGVPVRLLTLKGDFDVLVDAVERLVPMEVDGFVEFMAARPQ